MNRTALPLVLSLLTALPAAADLEVRTGAPRAQDSAFAERAAQGSKDRVEVSSLEVSGETGGQVLGETSEGYFVRRSNGRVVLSNGQPYSRHAHGTLTKPPGGDSVAGTGTRVRLGPNTIDQLEFSSRVEAMNFAALGITTDQPSAAEVRSNRVLVVQGPLAEDVEGFAKLRQRLALPSQRVVDALFASAPGGVVATGRYNSPFRMHYRQALASMRDSGGARDVARGHRRLDQGEGVSNALRHPGYVVEVNSTSSGDENFVNEFSQSFLAQHQADLASTRARNASQTKGWKPRGEGLAANREDAPSAGMKAALWKAFKDKR